MRWSGDRCQTCESLCGDLGTAVRPVSRCALVWGPLSVEPCYRGRTVLCTESIGVASPPSGNLYARYPRKDNYITENGSSVAAKNLGKGEYNQIMADITTSFTVLIGIFFPSVTGEYRSPSPPPNRPSSTHALVHPVWRTARLWWQSSPRTYSRQRLQRTRVLYSHERRRGRVQPFSSALNYGTVSSGEPFDTFLNFVRTF